MIYSLWALGSHYQLKSPLHAQGGKTSRGLVGAVSGRVAVAVGLRVAWRMPRSRTT